MRDDATELLGLLTELGRLGILSRCVAVRCGDVSVSLSPEAPARKTPEAVTEPTSPGLIQRDLNERFLRAVGQSLPGAVLPRGDR
jgi:hypothetical protein